MTDPTTRTPLELVDAVEESAAPRPGSDRWYLATAPMLRALIHLCVPMAAGFLVTAVYNLVNAGFIGSLHDSALLAAVTVGSPVLALVMAIGGVFGTGGSALISRLLGASADDPGEARRIKHVASFSVWGAVLAGIAVGGVGLFALHPLTIILGAPASAAGATAEYVGVLLAFVPTLAAAFCLEQIVRSEGASRQVMIGLVISTLANLAFDAFFILGLGWGVAGAALGLGLANLVAAAYYIAWLTRRSEVISVHPRYFTLSPTVLKPVLGVGASELLQTGFVLVSSLVLNHLAAGYGDGPLAAMGVAVRIAQVPEFLVMGVTIGVLPLLAYAVGSGDSGRLSAALRGSATTVGVITLAFTAIVLAFREQVFGAFVSDTAMLATGVSILAAQLVSMIFNGFTGLLTSLFQAAGRALPAMIISTTQALFFIPIVLVGNALLGLPGLIWGLTLSEAIVLVTALAMCASIYPALRQKLADRRAL